MHDGVKIVENAYVLTCDPTGSGGSMSVIIRSGKIAALLPPGKSARSAYPEAEIVDASGKILIPGFVDAHYHGESYLLDMLSASGTSESPGQNSRVQQATAFLRERATADDWVRLYRIAYYQALRSGVTTIVEFGYAGNDAAFSASVEALRKTDIRGFVGAHTGDQIEAARTLRSATVRPLLVLPPSDELTTYNLQTTLRQARELALPMIAHLGETAKDAEQLRRNFRKSCVQVLDEYQLFSIHHVPTHLSVLDGGDAEILKRSHAQVVVTPAAALRKGVEVPPLGRLLDAGVGIVLGSDSGPIRPWENLHALWTLIAQAGERHMSAIDLLKTHTSAGAQLMGVEAELGSIIPGRRADIVLMRCADADIRGALETEGSSVIAELLLHRASTSDITDVMVGGEFFVREREILTYAQEDLIADMKNLIRLAVPDQSQERASLGTPVMALSTSDDEEKEEGTFEEGFRVVRKDDAPSQPAAILPLLTVDRPAKELPPTVRKVFGDDDI